MLTKYLLIEGESDKNSTDEESEDGITYILITIAAKLLQLLHNNIDSLKRPDIIKGALKKLKSFIVKDKKMPRTNMIARIVSDQRRQTAIAAAAKPGPSNQRRRRQPRQRIGVKNIEGKICSRS